MKRVLVVDDCETEKFHLSKVLSKHGYEVVAAQSGEDGIRIAESEHPDLVLMDIVMPGINGFQATRQLSRNPQTSDIPVIMVTTKNQQADRAWSLQQGASGFLVKPVAEKELITTIESVLTIS